MTLSIELACLCGARDEIADDTAIPPCWKCGGIMHAYRRDGEAVPIGWLARDIVQRVADTIERDAA